MAAKKAEICPLSGEECDKSKCGGPIKFESRNPAALAVKETVSMCASRDAIKDDNYVMGVREDVMRMHERVLAHTRSLPYIENLLFRGN